MACRLHAPLGLLLGLELRLVVETGRGSDAFEGSRYLPVDRMSLEARFGYGEREVTGADPESAWIDSARGARYLRDREAEATAIPELLKGRDGGTVELPDGSLGLLPADALAAVDSGGRAEERRAAAIPFDTVVLDEAQAIKNPRSQTAKAAQGLEVAHRFALTGTPVENHLGELASIFGFLNPGMLGRLPSLRALADPRRAGPSELMLASRALRPMILRRTKETVLPELPRKLEQTLYCDLSVKERRRYDELLRP